MHFHQKLNLIGVSLLLFMIGAMTSYPIGYFRALQHHFKEIEWVDDINEKISIVKMLEIKNGKIAGKLSGPSIRLAYANDKILSLNDGDSFSIPLGEVHLASHYQANNLPENAWFVASKNGKYYYSIFEKQAFSIIEKNRIYFSSEEEARANGFLKR